MTLENFLAFVRNIFFPVVRISVICDEHVTYLRWLFVITQVNSYRLGA